MFCRTKPRIDQLVDFLMIGISQPGITLIETSINPTYLLFSKYIMSDCKCPTTGVGCVFDNVLVFPGHGHYQSSCHFCIIIIQFSLFKCKYEIVKSVPLNASFICWRVRFSAYGNPSDTLLWEKLSCPYIMFVFHSLHLFATCYRKLIWILHLVRLPNRMLHLMIRWLPFFSFT